jgi:hypothetical protein
MFAAIRRASSFVSSLAADLPPRLILEIRHRKHNRAVVLEMLVEGYSLEPPISIAVPISAPYRPGRMLVGVGREAVVRIACVIHDRTRIAVVLPMVMPTAVAVSRCAGRYYRESRDKEAPEQSGKRQVSTIPVNS